MVKHLVWVIEIVCENCGARATRESDPDLGGWDTGYDLEFLRAYYQGKHLLSCCGKMAQERIATEMIS